jgi:hypothetical protein
VIRRNEKSSKTEEKVEEIEGRRKNLNEVEHLKKS